MGKDGEEVKGDLNKAESTFVEQRAPSPAFMNELEEITTPASHHLDCVNHF